MSAVHTFTFNSLSIRAVTIDGALWFPAVDIARAIKASVAVISPHIKRTVDASEVRSLKFGDCPYQIYREIEPKANNLTLVSESGLYKFILRAHPSNPVAKAFQDWVTQVVLPRIRQDGAYIKDEEKVATGEMSAEDLLVRLPHILGQKLRRIEAEAQVFRV